MHHQKSSWVLQRASIPHLRNTAWGNHFTFIDSNFELLQNGSSQAFWSNITLSTINNLPSKTWKFQLSLLLILYSPNRSSFFIYAQDTIFTLKVILSLFITHYHNRLLLSGTVLNTSCERNHSLLTRSFWGRQNAVSLLHMKTRRQRKVR